MIEVKAPEKYDESKFAIFLAGSIEMGEARDWQQEVTAALQNHNIMLSGRMRQEDKILILNPRRTDWDSSWEQSIDHPKFKEQVDWELDGIFRADLVLFYFDPATKAPITLMELGYVAANNPSAIVCCPPGYWRKGNVDILCKREGIPVIESYDDLLAVCTSDMRELI